MPSSPTSRSPSRSSTSAALLLAAGALGACNGDPECGPADVPSTGIAASSADVTIAYENLTALVGNDCPDDDPPAGVVSVSLEGHQVGNELERITICIPRPDLLELGMQSLGTSQSMADVRIFDLTGDVDGCTYTLDVSRPPTGTAGARNVCDNGGDGFVLELDGAVSLRRTCGATIDTVAVTLRGTTGVGKRPI